MGLHQPLVCVAQALLPVPMGIRTGKSACATRTEEAVA